MSSTENHMIPSRSAYRLLAKSGRPVPIRSELMADLETPVSAFLKLHDGRYGYLLESVEGGEKWARYSFIGCGQMGEALLRGMLTAKLVTPDRVLVTDLAEERRKTIVQRYGIRGMGDGRAVAKGADVLLLAHPAAALTATSWTRARNRMVCPSPRPALRPDTTGPSGRRMPEPIRIVPRMSRRLQPPARRAPGRFTRRRAGSPRAAPAGGRRTRPSS